jgi:predicted aminopeptidase
MHAGAGQFHMLYHSVPIDEALKDESLTPDQKDRLGWVAEIKAFGESELGLKKTRNYQTVYLQSRQSPIYTVSASPKDRLTLMTWWFPIIGYVPYLGFFDLERARSKQDALFKQDLDVMIGRADAYSTLGWFKDPVTLNLLEGSINNLAETILHEMTHTTLYVKDQGIFNEGLANLVGKVGAVAFFQKTYGCSHPLTRKAQMILKDERLFATFIDTLIQRLETLYDSSFSYDEKLIQREKVFQESLNEFNQLKTRLHTDRFAYFGTGGLNNAYIMAVGLYHRYFNDFEKIYQQRKNSVKETLRFFQDMAGNEGDILKGMKISLEEWGPGSKDSLKLDPSCGHSEKEGHKS